MTVASVSVVVPAFNEEVNLAPTIDVLVRALDECVSVYEIIVVDDGSTDATAEIADGLAERYAAVRVVHNERNMGLGYSYVRGVEAATKPSVVFIPGDNGWPYESVVRLFRRIGDAQIVTSYTTNPHVRPVARRLLSRLYTACVNRLFGHRLRYYNGLTIYPIEFMRSRPVTTFGFAFMAEALLRGLDRGLSCVEVGLAITERASGRSKALKLRNVVSVIVTLGRLFWELRISKRRTPSSAGYRALG